MRHLLLWLCVTCSGLAAQAPQWRLHAQVEPNPLSGSVLVYDHLRDRVVRFGGNLGYVPLALLHELDGDTWIPTGTHTVPWPAGRASHAMAYDSARAEVILHSGSVIGPFTFTDTWRWNGSVWTQATPANVPPPMYEPTLTYDEVRARMVLFGTGGTYEWDGSNWHQRLPVHSPALRFGHASAYDARRARTVVFGGSPSGSSQHLDDTWEWDGSDWTQIATPGPTATYPSMAFDRERGRCVMIGTGPAMFEYDGQVWTPAPAPPGAPGFDLALAYDRQRGRIVCYANRDHNGQNGGKTWSYAAPGLAVAQPFGTGCGNPPLAATEDPAARPRLGTTLGVDLANVPAGLAFQCLGWSNRQVLGLSLPLRMEPFGLPGCWLLQSDDFITLPCAPTGPTSARFSLAIPGAAAFVGLRFFLQPWAPAPGLNPAGAAIGNGVAVTIGSL